MDRKFYKLFFIGLGGAGQRHLRIFREILPNSKFYGFRKKNKTPLLNKDFSVSKEESLSKKYEIELLTDIQKINDIKPDLTIISVPNSLHFHYTEIAINANSNVLVEKPGLINFSDFKRLENLLYESKLLFKIGYQRKYHPLYNLISHYLNSKKFGGLIEINMNVSSYIPDWHPYEDFRELYACKKELGGGVFTTECHELDMIFDLFGKPHDYKFNFFNSNKNLNEVSDSMTAEINYSNFCVNLDVSFFRKPTQRIITFKFEEELLKWDIDTQTLYLGKNNEKILNLSMPNDYLFKLQAIDTLKFDYKKTSYTLDKLKIYTSIIKNINI